MSRTETIVWTALPNGIDSPGHVKLSVFVTPQLQTNEGGTYPLLSLFSDFVDWPATLLGQARPVIAPLSFTVVFAGYAPVTVGPDMSLLDASQWAAIFDPAMTYVESWNYVDPSTAPIHTFDVNDVLSYVSTLYGKLGAASPALPPVLTVGPQGFEGPRNNRSATAIFDQLIDLSACSLGGYRSNLPPGVYLDGDFGEPVSGVCAVNSFAMGAARAFHVRPPLPPAGPNSPPLPFVPATPTLDFHQAVSSLGDYPAVLRNLGLAFDLVVPLPPGLTNGTVNVSVTPSFHTAFPIDGDGTTVNVSPLTRCTLSHSAFRAVPVGEDYTNGMLDLADTTRFSVNDLDVDGAAETLASLSQALTNIDTWATEQQGVGQTMAMTVPALRSTGPSIVWSGWATQGSGLNELMARQTTIANDVQAWVKWYLLPAVQRAHTTEPPLPVLLADDVIKGHRFDVLDESEPVPTWRSLHERIGSYVFGDANTVVNLPAAADNNGLPAGQDESTSTPGASTAAGIPNPPPDLWVHEEIVRWPNWSLAAPRPGQVIQPDDVVGDPPGNPADTTVSNGLTNAQLSATFTVVPGSLPKLRFGNVYRYRARGVDLSGNSLSVSSTDASTATKPSVYLRYQPVLAPVMAQTAPLGPGEATLLLPILDFNPTGTPATSVDPNGRWLFPPKASEMLAELHGMLDGYRAGLPPRRNLAPSATSYGMLAGDPNLHIPGKVDGTLGESAGAQTDTSNNGSVYIPADIDAATPWLPDPLARGVTLRGFPEDLEPTVREWLGGPWPGADPLLLLLESGGAVGHSYTPATATTPSTEVVTLPAGDSLDLAISSSLTSPVTLGVWWWMESQALDELDRLELAVLAERGQLWMLTPYRVLRLVHAVLVPLTPPTFANPQVSRLANSVQATITDPDFVLDAKSSADIDAQAVWTDPMDIPGQDPSSYTVTTTQHAFKTNVPDPGPLEATDRPMEVISAPTSFAITDGGVVHTIGDTLHHEVAYTCTATSRFAELFLTTVTTQLATTPATTAVSQYGFDLTTLVVATSDGTELAVSSDGGVTGDYLATAGGTLALTTGSSSAYTGQNLVVTFVPADTSTGPAFSPVHILSTAPPKAPKVVRVSPAWSNSLDGEDVVGGGVTFQRVGGFVRVYLERPWWSSGGGELLGVVGVNPADDVGAVLPAGVSASQVTTMGLDPISVSSLDEVFPISPTAFGSLATVPAVPYRPAYANPPLLPLVEDPSGPQMAIWPYEVNYDPISDCWYADVAVSTGEAIDGPPPGWFLRLALVRFQPFAIAGAEISQLALCTFCQPVPDRTVSVVENTFDPTASSVEVTVSGPGYYGFRPPNPASASVQPDYENQYALQPYSTGRGTTATSTIVVEVQVQDTSRGLGGDLAWTIAPDTQPMALSPSFNGADEIVWNTPDGLRGIPLPYPLASATPMRLRISELDYFPFNDYDGGVPASVDTSFRRPFVVHIPVNYVPSSTATDTSPAYSPSSPS